MRGGDCARGNFGAGTKSGLEKVKRNIFIGLSIWLAIVALLHFVNVRMENQNPSGENKFFAWIYFLGIVLFYSGYFLSLIWPGIHGLHAELLSFMAEVFNDIFYGFIITALVLKFRVKRKSL
jgi:hypothetical protein